MAVFEIPIDPTPSSFVQETRLEGTTYRFLFRWNFREEYWYLSLLDLDDVAISSGMKLVPGALLLRHVADFTIRPPGELMVVGIPTRGNLGTDAVLTYVEESGP
jgi:hypothetical protein